MWMTHHPYFCLRTVDVVVYEYITGCDDKTYNVPSG